MGFRIARAPRLHQDIIAEDERSQYQRPQQSGLTPLLIATKFCKIGIVKMLLAAGADPNTPSRFNLANLTSVYPLEYALMNYHEEIAVTLLQGGALPELVHGALRDMYEDFGADTREPEERKLLRKRRDMLSIMLRHGLDPAQGLSGNRYAVCTI